MISIDEGAKRLVTVCAALTPEEHALIITDNNKLRIAQAVQRYILEEMRGNVTMLVMPPQTVGGEEPLPEAAAAMKNTDVVFALNSCSLSQTNARMEANKAGARWINFPDVQESDLTQRLMQADFAAVSPYVHQVAERLTNGKRFRITAPGGTDIAFDGTGRAGRGLDAMVRGKGAFRSMSVEANIGPLEESTQGIFVVDGSIPDVGPLDAPVSCLIENGRIVKIGGGTKADLFAKRLAALNDPNIYYAGEFGIGMNPCAILTGNSYLEDESAISTCHIGFGTNIAQGGTDSRRRTY